jgi:hypothetical protein
MNSIQDDSDATMLSKDRILDLLHKLDNRLKRKIRLDVGGGAAAILKYGIERRTTDVDVIKSSIPVDAIRDTIQEIANEAGIPHNPLDELWLNDNAKRVREYLAQDYEDRLTQIPDTFKNIELHFISKVDLVIMKLSVDKIRDRDIADVSALKLTLQERNLIHRIIDSISRYEPDFAGYMENKFAELQPELLTGKQSISDRKDIKTVEDLCSYSENVCRLKVRDEFIPMWKADLLSGETTMETLINTVDSLAAKNRKGKKQDSKKEHDHGPER